jgi:hypothetical protein
MQSNVDPSRARRSRRQDTGGASGGTRAVVSVALLLLHGWASEFAPQRDRPSSGRRASVSATRASASAKTGLNAGVTGVSDTGCTPRTQAAEPDVKSADDVAADAAGVSSEAAAQASTRSSASNQDQYLGGDSARHRSWRDRNRPLKL